MKDLEINVVQIKGNCPIYREGDSFLILDGYKLKAEKTICMHSLVSIAPYYVALSHGISPGELGLATKGKDIAYVQCLDPCEYIGGGTAVFSIKKIKAQ
jgi:uncharacterized repeat protein (TIGR04076 family)